MPHPAVSERARLLFYDDLISGARLETVAGAGHMTPLLGDGIEEELPKLLAILEEEYARSS